MLLPLPEWLQISPVLVGGLVFFSILETIVLFVFGAALLLTASFPVEESEVKRTTLAKRGLQLWGLMVAVATLGLYLNLVGAVSLTLALIYALFRGLWLVIRGR